VTDSSQGTGPAAGTTASIDAGSDAGTDADEQARREEALVARVLEAYAGAPDARDREIAAALIRHLHAFVREVRLSEAEWEAGIAFLTAVGHITTDTRQEFILLSDTLGASMQTVTVNSPAHGDATESTVFGPFFVAGSPEIEVGGDMAQGAKGTPCHVSGRVTGTDGTPVSGARIEVWESDEDGFYDVQYQGGRTQGRAHLFSAPDGRYAFWGVTPSAYPIPHDGPVGRMLERMGRHPYRPAHLHFKVTAPGYRTLVTHIFVPGDRYLDSDAVFGVKESLVVPFEQHGPGPAPGRVLDGPWTSAVFDIVLAPASAAGAHQPAPASAAGAHQPPPHQEAPR
jgi:hydroxyquinol 1,2-dioxygenase